ncbi:hypothetical protein Gotri_026985 [Gossypium trilobum]|uniref:Uncharacterized protein n=1 Tax=Gossypium trilobum TaxID=34281 RepID=A0A7J9FLF7_9ROSI|nr:hypothetical protein [Gossypium trilobum]
MNVPPSSSLGANNCGRVTKKGQSPHDLGLKGNGVAGDDEDIAFEGDFTTGIVDGVSSIKFSERIHNLIKLSMARTMVVKLCGRYSHVNEGCSFTPRNESQRNNPSENQPEQPRTVSPVEKEKYVDWMVVQRTSRKQTWKGDNSVTENQGSNRGRLKFDILANLEEDSAVVKEVNGASFDDFGGFSLGSARQTREPKMPQADHDELLQGSKASSSRPPDGGGNKPPFDAGFRDLSVTYCFSDVLCGVFVGRGEVLLSSIFSLVLSIFVLRLEQGWMNAFSWIDRENSTFGCYLVEICGARLANVAGPLDLVELFAHVMWNSSKWTRIALTFSRRKKRGKKKVDYFVGVVEIELEVVLKKSDRRGNSRDTSLGLTS